MPAVDDVVSALTHGTWSALLPTAVTSALLLGKAVTADLTPTKVSGTGKTVTFRVDSVRRR